MSKDIAGTSKGRWAHRVESSRLQESLVKHKTYGNKVYPRIVKKYAPMYPELLGLPVSPPAYNYPTNSIVQTTDEFLEAGQNNSQDPQVTLYNGSNAYPMCTLDDSIQARKESLIHSILER